MAVSRQTPIEGDGARYVFWLDWVVERIGMVKLIGILMLCIVGTMLLLWFKSQLFMRSSVHRHSASDLMIHTQRIGKAVGDALAGKQDAFDQLQDSRLAFERELHLLAPGKWAQESTADDAVARRHILSNIRQQWQQTDQAIAQMMHARQALLDRAESLRRLYVVMPEFVALANRLAHHDPVAGQRVMKSVGDMMLPVLQLAEAIHITTNAPAMDSMASAEGVLRADALNNAGVLMHAGSGTQEIAGQLRMLLTEYRDVMVALSVHAAVVEQAGYAARTMIATYAVLTHDLAALASGDRTRLQAYPWMFWVMRCAIVLSLLCAIAIVRLRWKQANQDAQEAEKRLMEAESERCYAQQQEEKAMRAKESNEQAILLLTTALQQVAAGDLTVRIPVTDNVVSQIVDAVNETIHALRALVGRTTQMAQDVTQVTAAFGVDFNRLMDISRKQSSEITNAEQSIQTMTRQMHQVLRAANASADVARQSVEFAEHGGRAVENIVKGMGETREQIQETSQRIKRLGDSSLEIGEITALISGITEQTNVLALNAAIQAASAGEAGRGFTVVAEEVQRLAERSSAATRQIARLVKTIQVDTHDAVSAMEKTTAGVVDATRLSDAAGIALSDIRRVSTALADLVGDIVHATKEQTEFTERLAKTMQCMSTDNMAIGAGRDQFTVLYKELDNVAGELKQSVSRFRIAVV